MTESSPLPTSPGKRRIPAWAAPVLLCFLVSCCLVLPFFWLGSASGHDFEFHAASWFDAAFQWKEGTLYPRWTAWTNHGFGEPRFIFYPPLSWMLGAALTLAVSPPWVPILLTVFTQTFAGLSAFFLVRRFASPRSAALAAACYVVNPGAMLMTYIRSDFAEQLACAFFPLALLGALRIAGLLEDAFSFFASIALFALSFAGVWLSNAPAGVIASYSVALLFALAALTQRSLRPLLRGAGGLVLGFGLASFYLVPAAYEQRWVNITQVLSAGLLPAENFLFTKIQDPEHTWFNWIASGCALLLILFTAVLALVSRRFTSREAPPARKGSAVVALLALGAASTFLTLRVTMPLWNLLPKLRFVQFPWRWMSILAVVFAVFLAIVLDRRRGWIWLLLFVVISAPLGFVLVNNGWWDADEMPTQAAAISSGSGFDGADEYDPLQDDHLDLPLHAPRVQVLSADEDGSQVPKARVHIERWSTEAKDLRVGTPQPVRVALRLLNYPAWRVQVNGHLVVPGRAEDVNQMVIPVAAGTSEIQVRFIRTSDRTVGLVLSLLSCVVTLLLFLAARRQIPRV
ncbi:MAG TPA: 6-pyruvoyl-tetrahydropterin synthase-related protein [Candidatus Acidoferrum sp.]